MHPHHDHQSTLDQASLSAFVEWRRTLRQHYGTAAHLRAADHDDAHHPPLCRVAHTAYLEAELRAQEYRLAMMGVRPVETRLLVVGPGTRGARTRKGLPPIGLLLALWVLALATLSGGTPAQSSPLHAASGRVAVVAENAPRPALQPAALEIAPDCC